MKIVKAICVLMMLVSCKDNTNTRLLDFQDFSIEIPKDWQYVKLSGIDSFVGKIVGPGVELEFDCSRMGYAGRLIGTPEEYVRETVELTDSEYFLKPNITYTNVDKETVRMENGVAVKLHPFPRPSSKIYLNKDRTDTKFKDADYLVDLTYNDSTITIGVTVPEEVKKQVVENDICGWGEFLVSTVYPRKAGDGMTGVYYESRITGFNLRISGYDLRADQQAAALLAFKTIRIKV